MPYVHRVVQAGRTVEHRKMQSFRVHTKGVKRGPNKGTTTERQARINERVAEEHLRWDLNGNFDHRDLHAVLHYYDKDTTFEEILAHKAAFLANLRKACRKRGIKYKAVVVIETKRMTNPHIHVVISRMDPEIITEAWENVPRGGGGISFKPLDRRGNHAKLAAYLMKESRSTMEKYREIGKRGKRYSKTQNMAKPVITYKVVPASSWRKEPKARKGAVLYKFDDGATCKSGWHEMTGYPYQEYFEVFNEWEDKPMKIYIAGKIAGDRRYRAKFREAAKAMEAAGHVVLNPATLPDGLTDGDYMRICMAMVDAADLAVFLPDYQESRGAMVEWAYCQRIGKDCAMYLDMKKGE